jgi:hypothetical protein
VETIALALFILLAFMLAVIDAFRALEGARSEHYLFSALSANQKKRTRPPYLMGSNRRHYISSMLKLGRLRQQTACEEKRVLVMKNQRSIISIAMATSLLVSLCAVCASTGVSADASPPGKPIAAGTGPSACFLKGSNYMYVFVTGYDHAIWYRIYDFSTMWWTGGWSSIGGYLTSSPTAVSWGNGRIDIFARGGDGHTWHNYLQNSWGGWEYIGGDLLAGTGPTVSSWAAGRLDLFVTGAHDSYLWHRYWQNGWGRWEPIGGHLTSSPAAVSMGNGRIDIFARGNEGHTWHQWWANGWGKWEDIGGQLLPGTGPAVSAWPANLDYYTIINRLDVFVVGNGERAMWQKTWTPSGWSSWANLGGQLTATPTAAAHPFSIEVYARWSNGNVCQKEYYADTPYAYQWHDWQCGMEGPPCQTDCY